MAGNLTLERVTTNCGAVVGGIDRRPLPDDHVAFLRRALVNHGVVFLRDQEMTKDQFWEATRFFGTPLKDETTGQADNTSDMVQSADMAPVRHSTAVWHADTTSLATPPWATVLRAISPCPYGGDTCWSSMYAAWDGLSEPMKGMLDGLTAVHSIQPTYDRMGAYAPYFMAQYDPLHPREQVHPVVLTHPETGRKALYVSESFVTRIVELPLHESNAILQFLFRHVERPDLTVRWKWSANDVAFWDNRCVQHYAVPDYETPRVMERIVLEGVRPGTEPQRLIA